MKIERFLTPIWFDMPAKDPFSTGRWRVNAITREGRSAPVAEVLQEDHAKLIAAAPVLALLIGQLDRCHRNADGTLTLGTYEVGQLAAAAKLVEKLIF